MNCLTVLVTVSELLDVIYGRLLTRCLNLQKQDANKEDNEDSINLMIGEDEVKLFGEEVSAYFFGSDLAGIIE